MNLTALQTALKRYGFDDPDPLTTWLNAGMRQFVDAYQWAFLEATGTPTVTTSAQLSLSTALTTFRKVRTVAIQDTTANPTYQKLLYWSAHRFDRELTAPTTQTGQPQIYTLVGLDAMTVWPVPDKSYRLLIRYIKSVPDLVNGTDIPAIPVEYHYTIVRAAAVIALQAESEEERAQAAEQGYEADLQSAIAQYGTHEEDDADQVEDTQGYGDG